MGQLLAECFEAVVESTLQQPTFVTDFPVEISPLAKPHRSQPGLVERFELYIAGKNQNVRCPLLHMLLSCFGSWSSFDLGKRAAEACGCMQQRDRVWLFRAHGADCELRTDIRGDKASGWMCVRAAGRAPWRTSCLLLRLHRHVLRCSWHSRCEHACAMLPPLDGMPDMSRHKAGLAASPCGRHAPGSQRQWVRLHAVGCEVPNT